MHWIVYGLLITAYGFWRVRQQRREHWHRCAACGVAWFHVGPCDGDFPTARAFADAHTCPKCGQEEFEIAPPPKVPVTERRAVAPDQARGDDPCKGKRAAAQPRGEGAPSVSGATAAPAEPKK